MADRRTDTSAVVRGGLEVLAGDGSDTLDEGLILLYSFVDSEDGTYILYDSASGDRQGAALDLLAQDSVDELLLTALRVLHLEGHNLGARVVHSDL